jgi:hypothetical protein
MQNGFYNHFESTIAKIKESVNIIESNSKDTSQVGVGDMQKEQMKITPITNKIQESAITISSGLLTD